MITLKEVLREEMKDPEFKREWDALEPEFQLIRQQLDAEKRKKAKKIKPHNGANVQSRSVTIITSPV